MRQVGQVGPLFLKKGGFYFQIFKLRGEIFGSKKGGEYWRIGKKAVEIQDDLFCATHVGEPIVNYCYFHEDIIARAGRNL